MIDDFLDFVVPVVVFFMGAALFVGGFMVGVRYIGHHYDGQACYSFGRLADREVRFVDYTFWSWDCLTPAGDGKWISTSRLREVTDE